jgi:hypothetical protein
MEPVKRRGRPKGSDLKSDTKLLHAVADLILADPALTPTAAIKKVVPEWTDTITRRLRGKWKAQSEALLEQARERREQRALRDAAYGTSSGTLGGIPSGASLLHFLNSPAYRWMREIENNPVFKLQRELANNPLIRMQRELANNPAVRMMREIQNNPAVRFAREQQRLRRLLQF